MGQVHVKWVQRPDLLANDDKVKPLFVLLLHVGVRVPVPVQIIPEIDENVTLVFMSEANFSLKFNKIGLSENLI